jgi:hypothetical protein
MNANINLLIRASVLGMALLAAGCGKRPPAITPAEGTVYFNGEPLANAQVQFVPMLPDFGAEYNSVGVTNEKGHFTLTCGDQSGAAVGRNRVLVLEGPVPAEARGQSEEAQKTFTKYMTKLKNRPIPTRYATVSQTPLEMEVTVSQKTYDVTLER